MGPVFLVQLFLLSTWKEVFMSFPFCSFIIRQKKMQQNLQLRGIDYSISFNSAKCRPERTAASSSVLPHRRTYCRIVERAAAPSAVAPPEVLSKQDNDRKQFKSANYH